MTRILATSMHGLGCLLLAMLAAIASRAEAKEASPASMLYLYDGDYLTGELEDCKTPNAVRWRAPGFAGAFEFPAGPFRAAYFAPTNEHPTPQGDYCFELSDGDLLYGSLAAITAESLEIDAVPFGRLHVARTAVRRFTPWTGAPTTEYRGPNGLAEWRQGGNEQWREEAGRLIATATGAEVQKEVPIPAQARIEFEISWSSIPEFTLVLATGASDEQLQEGYRFEVWDRTLVVVRACGQSADVATICELNTLTDRIHLEAFYDQSTGKLSIHLLDGKQLAEITVAEKNDDSQPLRLVSLTNRGADVRLEFLAIGPWNGQLPTLIDADKQRIRLADGTVLYGEITDYNSDTKQFGLRAEPEDRSDSEVELEDKLIDAAQVSCVVLTPSAASAKSLFRIGMQDGSRFSGELLRMAGEKLYLTRPGIEEPLACPLASVRSLVGITADYQLPEAKERVGMVEMEGVRSHGWLAETRAAAANGGDASCLIWQPRTSTLASSLTNKASGRVVYRERAQEKQDGTADAREIKARERRLQANQQVRVGGVAGVVLRVMTGDDADAPRKVKSNGAATLYLLGGDRIPCKNPQIDEEGVHFTSSVVGVDFVPNSSVKALELVPNWTAAALAEEKRQRLLTLPRMQKPNPPTHLIASTNGDFLRARLTAMSPDTLTVETRLESKQIPRKRVACLIWLHEGDDADHTKVGKDEDAVTTDSADTLHVQAVQASGVRLTFVPHDCARAILAGTSEHLGACKVDLATVDALVFGAAIQAAAAEQTYGTWKLTDATEPRYIRDAATGGAERPGGTESGLVGKPAPDFRLDLIDGGKFSIAEQKDHVVVLDFWASWCGPCMQAMPTVDAVVEEFAGDKVKLVAVNLQEDRVAATGALERLKIHPKVALDVDGAAAEKYQVTAIPQTVVIDADGNVAHVFVGTNPDFAAQLRAAIQNLLTPAAAQ